MVRTKPYRPENWDIFRGTQDGVPNPYTIIQHGYPTRFHGPMFNYPGLAYQYMERPYALAPFLGVDDDNGASAGLSEFMSSRWVDALMGASAGFIVAPNRSKLAYSALGAVGTVLLGRYALGAMLVLGAASKLAKKPLPALEV